MGLVDLRTDLKSLRYGKDRVGGGHSGQPYIQKSLPDTLSGTDKTGGIDFLLRGGSLVPGRTVDDVSRLTKMFFDLKSPNGLLFTAKENLLSRASVRTQASPIIFNNGTYLPTSTIAQAGVNALGIHLNKQGVDPTGLIAKTGFLVQPSYSNHLQDIESIEENRLLNLKYAKLDGFPASTNLNYKIDVSDNNLFKYDAGPGSILGIGRTDIKRYYNSNNKETLFTRFKGENFTFMDTIYNYEGYNEDFKTTIRPDFRTFKEQDDPKFSNLSKSLDYTRKNIENRVNLGNPGKKGNKSSYAVGKLDAAGNPVGAADTINALPLYSSDKGVLNTPKTKDLVQFRIGVINNDNILEKTYIHFRAFIDSMSDSYSSTWNGLDFVGRGETLYRYGGKFNRSINLAWTVAAQSKQELIPMYQKLNYLASVVAPDYSPSGYMRGNLITLTVGGWCYEQVGFIEGITYDVPQESPWEIAINDSNGDRDGSVKELPHMIKVTGFKFTPIHNFLPKIQKNNYELAEFNGSPAKFVSSYGSERYIALASNNSEGNTVDNYGDPNSGERTGGNPNYIPKNLTNKIKFGGFDSGITLTDNISPNGLSGLRGLNRADNSIFDSITEGNQIASNFDF